MSKGRSPLTGTKPRHAAGAPQPISGRLPVLGWDGGHFVDIDNDRDLDLALVQIRRTVRYSTTMARARSNGRGLCHLAQGEVDVSNPGVLSATAAVATMGDPTVLSLVLLHGTAIFYASFDAGRRFASPSCHAEGSFPCAIAERVRSLPGVLDVAQTAAVPMTMIKAGLSVRAEAPGEIPRTEGPYENSVIENFFRVAGLDIRDGRGFTERDRAGSPRVAVVNATFARLVWPGQLAVGRCLFVGREASGCTRVVGVAETALEFGVQDDRRSPHFYLPFEQALQDTELAAHRGWDRTLVVRTRGDPGGTVPAVLQVLAEVFPELPANRVRSLPAVFAPRIRSWTVGTGLFGVAALLALLLAVLGLYVVITFGVRQRELEFGIRRALGARASDLIRMVLARGLVVTAAGAGAGVVTALLAGRFVAPLLFDGRSPRDPLALTAAVLVLMAAATGASFLPARRAIQADPRRALQVE